jgi:cytoskeletal protein CcmA (bactofilin family)
VPSQTPQSAGKVAVECPHCGFKQLESPFAKSTFCRKCSEHFDLGKAVPGPRKEQPSLLSRLSSLFAGKSTRDVACFGCGATQTVSSSARSSICPQCSAYLDLSDFKIASTFSRSVETQGKFHATSKGDVTSAKISCGQAYIEGKLRGTLSCNGLTQIKLKGKLLGALDVNRLVIERRSEVEIVRPVKAHSVEILGKVSARLHVEGAVLISKRGWLEGTVYARSITVEKGGVFLGELIIGKQELTQPELLPLGAAENSTPSTPAQGTLKFGTMG